MPRDDDPPEDDWRDSGDTVVDVEASDLLELEADAVTPIRGPERLPGYELGRRDERMAFFAAWETLLFEERKRGAADVLAALRARLVQAGETQDGAAMIAAVVAKMAGFKLH